jgi:endonuclease YncB( thermonuclease family)
MGKRHNRRRTRLRQEKPLYRHLHTFSMPITSTTTDMNLLGNNDTITCRKQPRFSNDTCTQLTTHHTQFYGLDTGDESRQLCPLMLQVVLDLFDGVDYDDP